MYLMQYALRAATDCLPFSLVTRLKQSERSLALPKYVNLIFTPCVGEVAYNSAVLEVKKERSHSPRLACGFSSWRYREMNPRHLALRAALVGVVVALALGAGARSAAAGAVHSSKGRVKFKTLYTFTGGSDGYLPYSGLVFDAKRNLYGTTFFGGATQVCCGTVFQLAPKPGGSWSLNTIHIFVGSPDDVAHSYAHLTFDQRGNLYGTGGAGGPNFCPALMDFCGGIFRLTRSNSGWKESLIFNFSSSSGDTPFASLTLFKGDLYGSTWFGPEKTNDPGNGTVFLLGPGRQNEWKHHTIYSFKGGADGYEPSSDLVLDRQGNVYGSTPYGGGSADIFELTRNSRGGWKEKLVYSFPPTGSGSSWPSTLILDSAGNLYGATAEGGHGCRSGCGTIFELKRGKTGWQEITLYQFAGGSDGYNPSGGLVFDAQGNLYGTTFLGGTGKCQFYSSPGCGTVFKLTHAKDGTWHKTTLHNFTGGSDGEFPGFGSLIFDSAGNLYGTSEGGATFGSSGFGTVFEITP
jgi:uncharacterized protein YceK